MTAHDGLGSVRADARKNTTETHWDPATARLIDAAVAERDAWWRGQVEALAPAVLCAHEHPAEFAAMWDELMDELGQWRRGELSVPQPVPAPSDAPSIEDVLAEHEVSEPRGYAFIVCSCGIEFGTDISARAHVAQVLRESGSK